jgi:DNA-directed RNA polymerase specialized sigma24 family protein
VKEETADRTERILALLLLQGMKGATQAQKAVQLNIAGFTAAEIADLLETSTAVVHTHLYEMRKKKKRKK